MSGTAKRGDGVDRQYADKSPNNSRTWPRDGWGRYVGWVVEFDTGRDLTRDNEEQINRICMYISK